MQLLEVVLELELSLLTPENIHRENQNIFNVRSFLEVKATQYSPLLTPFSYDTILIKMQTSSSRALLILTKNFSFNEFGTNIFTLFKRFQIILPPNQHSKYLASLHLTGKMKIIIRYEELPSKVLRSVCSRKGFMKTQNDLVGQNQDESTKLKKYKARLIPD